MCFIKYKYSFPNSIFLFSPTSTLEVKAPQKAKTTKAYALFDLLSKMTLSLKFLIPALASAAAAIGAAFWYLGAFRPITFKNGRLGPVIFVYQPATGPYEKAGRLLQGVLTFLRKHNLESCVTAGLYFDDPKTTKATRFAIGFMVEKAQEKQFALLTKNVVQEWKILKIKETNTACSIFPVKMRPVSFALSGMKTYPAFAQQDTFRLQSGVLEIYGKETITTHFPQDNTWQFTAQI